MFGSVMFVELASGSSGGMLPSHVMVVVVVLGSVDGEVVEVVGVGWSGCHGFCHDDAAGVACGCCSGRVVVCDAAETISSGVS